MSEFQPITTVADLELQPIHEIVAGYLSGLANAPEPGSDKSRGFWHGWRNGRMDGGYAKPDAAQHTLVRAIVALHRAN